jgi:ABC-2 type transport system permease protein
MLFDRARLYQRYVIGRTAVRETLCYPTDVVIEFISYPIAFIGYFYFVVAMFEIGPGRLDEVRGGYSLSKLIAYFSVGWVLRMIFDQGVASKLAHAVQTGDVALSLVLPISLERYYLGWFIGDGIARLVYYGLPAWILLIALFGAPVHLDAIRLSWFVPFAVAAFVLAFEIQFFLGTLSFFFIMNHQISWSFDMLIRLASGLIVPLSLFPATLAAGLQLLPFQYLYYKPIEALLEPLSPTSLLIDLCVAAGWIIAFRLGNRRLVDFALRRHVIYGS